MRFRGLRPNIVAAVMTMAWFLGAVNELCFAAAGESVIQVTRGLPDVSLAASSTEEVPRCYGLGYLAQVGPTTAALFSGLRTIGPNRHDYEDGTDIFVFDNLSCVNKRGPTPISRNERDPKAEVSRFIVKFPAAGGFWPLGAKRFDGSPHPGAGKGFAFCQALSFAGRGDTLVSWNQSYKRYVEVMQLTFDGRLVSVVGRNLIQSGWLTPDGWRILAPGLAMAIPKGDDLLMAVVAMKGERSQAGVCSWRYLDGRWQPVAFTPVTSGTEPSLVRCKDESLVFGVRSAIGGEGNSIMLWRLADGGGDWKQTLHATKTRTESPVSVHATPDGRVFVAANVFGAKRSQLAIWPLTEGTIKLGPPCVIRDCQKESGSLPNGINWYVDHPISAILRLGDARWHGIMTYRVVAFPNVGKVEPIMPQTGCYLEDVSSAQPLTPPWRF